MVYRWFARFRDECVFERINHALVARDNHALVARDNHALAARDRQQPGRTPR
jgi:hypothetical protein